MINIVIDQLLACKTLTPKNEVIQCFRFKQAKEGECTVAKPSFYQLTEKSKWNAWKELTGMGRAEAMTQYIEKANFHLKNMSNNSHPLEANFIFDSRFLLGK